MFDLNYDPLKDLREFFHDQSEALQNAAGRPARASLRSCADG